VKGRGEFTGGVWTNTDAFRRFDALSVENPSRGESLSVGESNFSVELDNLFSELRSLTFEIPITGNFVRSLILGFLANELRLVLLLLELSLD